MQTPAPGSRLRDNRACLMSPRWSQTIGLGRDVAAFLDTDPSNSTTARGLLETSFAASGVQPKSRVVEGGSTHSPAGHSPEELPVYSDSQGQERVNHRLLIGKLGGWGHGSPISGGPVRWPSHVGEAKVSRQKASPHVAPRALPAYLTKLVNQLMRHGKKGVSVGLLADSLTLFCEKLEEGGRSNLYNRGARSAILAERAVGEGLRTSRSGKRSAPNRTASIALGRKATESPGIPSFPFYLASFPGASFGEAFSQGKGHLGTLLGLPFSGALSPRFSIKRLSFVKEGGERRGVLGVEAPLGHGACNASPSNPNAVLPNGSQSPNGNAGVTAHASPARAGVGLRFHTKRPVYFWPLKGHPLGGSAALGLHLKGAKAQVPLPPRGPSSDAQAHQGGVAIAPPLARQAKHGPWMANEPQASVLSHLARAISNVEPSLEVRKKKIAGITRQIPCTVPKARGERLAIRWIITSARERVRRRGKGLSSCLAEELIDAYYKRGEPRQRRDSLHKAAESNRSFLRYRWW